MDSKSETPKEKSSKKDDSKTSTDSPAADPNKSRGWPKGKKRYLKTPGAPKQPLSGYVHFLNDRRDAVRKEFPDLSFADISKKLAADWSAVGPEEKQRYHERAEHDKERYNKEFADYQLTPEYKKHMEDVIKKEAEEASGNANGADGEKSKKKPKKGGKSEKENKAAAAAAAAADEDSKDSSDFPIFTDEFLEFNKARETEMRQLRKQVTEMEEQNAVLAKHVDNMKSAITKLEGETSLQNENTQTLNRHFESLKAVIASGFANAPLPGRAKSDPITMENVESFMKTIHAMTVEKSMPRDEALISAVANIVNKLDYKSVATS